jgi:hypothetical protein
VPLGSHLLNSSLFSISSGFLCRLSGSGILRQDWQICLATSLGSKELCFMMRHRPALVLTMGIINLVFGTLALLCGCLATFGQVMTLQTSGGPPPGPANPNLDVAMYIEKQVPGHTAIEIVTCVVITLGALIVIADGVGLILMHPWARWTAIGYAAIVIFYNLAYIVFKVAFVHPAASTYVRTNMGGMNAQSAMVGFNVAFFLVLGFQTGLLILHASALLLVMLLPGVAAAFAGKGADSLPGPDEGWSAAYTRNPQTGQFRA